MGSLLLLSSLHDVKTLELIELANRMCLDGLVAIAEQFTVAELRRREESGANVMEDVLGILEIAQVWIRTGGGWG